MRTLIIADIVKGQLEVRRLATDRSDAFAAGSAGNLTNDDDLVDTDTLID